MQFNTLFFLQTWRNIQCQRKMSWILLVSDTLPTVARNKFHIQQARYVFSNEFFIHIRPTLAAIIHVI